jgi:hypothetical protein
LLTGTKADKVGHELDPVLQIVLKGLSIIMFRVCCHIVRIDNAMLSDGGKMVDKMVGKMDKALL